VAWEYRVVKVESEGLLGGILNAQEHERRVAATRAALGEEAFAAAWKEGRENSFEGGTI
jgi:hypothetical protein